MYLHEINELTWTIREANHIFLSDPGSNIPVSTIQTWMQRKVFQPAVPAKRRDPRGSRLNLSDIVMLMLLDLLFLVGIKFGQLSTDCRWDDSEELWNRWEEERAKCLEEPKGRKTTAVIYFFRDGFSAEQNRALNSELKLNRRPIQTFFELCHYDCVVHASVSPPGVFKDIYFIPTPYGTENEPGKFLLESGRSMIPRADIFVDVRAFWFRALASLGPYIERAPFREFKEAFMKKARRIKKALDKGKQPSVQEFRQLKAMGLHYDRAMKMLDEAYNETQSAFYALMSGINQDLGDLFAGRTEAPHLDDSYKELLENFKQLSSRNREAVEFLEAFETDKETGPED